MDPFTHMVAGALVGQIFAPEDPHRFAFGLVCAGAGVVSDVDFVARKAKESLLFLQLHRGFTHSLFALPIIGVCAAGSGNLLFGAPFWPLLLAAILAAGTHLLLDVIMHATGLRIFWPARRKSSLHLVVGLNPLTSSARCGERNMTVCLRCAMHSALLSPLTLLLWVGFVGTLFTSAYGLASAAVLGLAPLYLLYAQAMRVRARSLLRASLKGPAQGQEVYPGAFSPNVWVGVVSRQEGYEVKQIHALSGKVEQLATHAPSASGAEVEISRGTATIQEFLANAVTPHVTLYQLQGRPLVVWRDLAFAFSHDVSLFAARVLLNEEQEVAAEEFRERWDQAPETGAVRA